MGDPLAPYRSKRDFRKTPEPAGGTPRPQAYARFVVQKHAATRLHYDVRLEVEGVLASWAVPKGPSLDPKDRRLAMRTEDHPLDYMFFEGVVPKKEYGAGPVLIWDIGVYVNLDKPSVASGIRNGQVKVWLQGTKLEGGWALVRIESKDATESWLMIKERDEKAKAGVDPTKTRPASAVTGRTLEDLVAGKTAAWRPTAKRKDPPATRRTGRAGSGAARPTRRPVR